MPRIGGNSVGCYSIERNDLCIKCNPVTYKSYIIEKVVNIFRGRSYLA